MSININNIWRKRSEIMKYEINGNMKKHIETSKINGNSINSENGVKSRNRQRSGASVARSEKAAGGARGSWRQRRFLALGSAKKKKKKKKKKQCEMASIII